MSTEEWIGAYQSTAYAAADKVAPLVKSRGWDRDDCRQEANLVLLRLVKAAGPIQAARFGAYLTVCVRRAIWRATRPPEGAAVTYADDVAEAVARDNGLSRAVDLDDLLHAAPPDVRAYLKHRVLDGRGWDDVRESMGWSDRRMDEVRLAAADWLLKQYEPEGRS